MTTSAPDRWTYQHTDTGDLLRRARRFLAQWTDIPAPSTRVPGDSSPQLVYLLACEVERLEQRNADLHALLAEAKYATRKPRNRMEAELRDKIDATLERSKL